VLQFPASRTNHLARLANLPNGLYILLAFISFFLFFFLFFNDFSENNYLRISGPIFALFSPNESVFAADDDLHLFFDISRDVAMATDFVKKWQTHPPSSLRHSKTEWDIVILMCELTA